MTGVTGISLALLLMTLSYSGIYCREDENEFNIWKEMENVMERDSLAGRSNVEYKTISRRTKREVENTEIVENLVKNYNKNVPPKTTTEVKVGMYVLWMDVISKNMEMKMIAYLRQQWRDERLNYTQSDKPIRLHDLSLPIWTPDTFMRNSKESRLHDMMVLNQLIRISSNGGVWLVTKISFTVACPMNFKNFPMDKQTCTIVIESFGYTADVVYYIPMDYQLENVNGTEVSEFSVTNTFHRDCSQTYHTGTYPCLEFIFTLQRSCGYYMWQVYFPSIWMVILSWFSFWLEITQTTGRILLTLLSFIAILYIDKNSLQDIIGNVSYSTALRVWLLVCSFFIFASLVEFFVVIIISKPRRKNSAEVGINNNESTGNKVDIISRAAFPILFALFNIIYWTCYK